MKTPGRLRFLAAPLLLAACATPLPPDQQASRIHREAMHRLSRGGDPAEALEQLDEAILLDPAPADFYRSRSIVHRILGRLPEAIADLTAQAERERTPVAKAVVLLDRALLQEEMRRPEAGIADIGLALEAAPDYIEAYLQRARLLRMMNRPSEAEQDLAEARRRGAAMATRFYNHGAQLLLLSETENAVRMLSFAVDLDDRQAPFHTALGRAYMQLRRFEDAELSYSTAIALQPDEAYGYYHRGNARLALGRLEEALEDFHRSVELDPKHAAVLTARGALLLKVRKDSRAALADFTAAIDLDADLRPALLQRGRLHAEARRHGKAEADLLAALKIRADGGTTLLLAQVVRDTKEFKRAEYLCGEALKLCGDDEELEQRIRLEIEEIRAEAEKRE